MERQRVMRVLQTGSSRAFSAVGTFLLTLVAARALDTRELGVFFAAFTILTTIAAVAQFGMDMGITWVIGYLAPSGQKQAVRKWLYLNCLIVLFISNALLVVLVVSRHQIARAFSLPELSTVLPVMLLAIAPFAIGNILGGALRGLGKSEFSGLQSGGSSFLAAIILAALTLRVSDMTVREVALWYLASSVVMCAFLFVMFILFTGRKFYTDGQAPGAARLPNLQDYLGRCWHIWTGQIFATMVSFWPTLLIANMVSAQALGAFKVSERVVALVGVILVVLNDVFAPRYSNFYRLGARAALANEIRQSSRVIFALAALPVLIIVLFSRQIITIFHADFLGLYYIIPIMMLGQVASVLSGPSGILLAMTDDQKSVSVGQFVGLAVALVSYPVLVHFAGLGGAAVAWALVLAAQNFYFAMATYRHLGISPVPFWPNPEAG
jgi:O-antigen/teichoic acid export membrane protein